MPDSHEPNFLPVVDPATVETTFLPNGEIELVAGFRTPDRPEHVVFDFDGTLSLIREGWPEIMIPMFVDHLAAIETGESRESLTTLCKNFVMELTGKQTIYQMIRLCEEIQKRGGVPQDPLDYKTDYHDRLMHRIESRREALRTGQSPPDDWLVPGSVSMLEGLQSRGAVMYLASGTDENFVREEVELLGLDRFFDGKVYGAREDYRSFSKAQVIRRILEENALDGSSLAGLGDGYVEIQNIREVGGLAVAVASDEAHRSGRPDPWKRRRLIAAGANIVVPDFRESARLLDFLFED